MVELWASFVAALLNMMVVVIKDWYAAAQRIHCAAVRASLLVITSAGYVEEGGFVSTEQSPLYIQSNLIISNQGTLG